MSEPRVYDTSTYRKHKRPKGWGSLCPKALDTDPESLLQTGVWVEGCIYNVCGQYAFQANMHEPDKWHGYPIPWSRLPTAAVEALIAAGRLSSKEFRAAVRKGLGADDVRG